MINILDLENTTIFPLNKLWIKSSCNVSLSAVPLVLVYYNSVQYCTLLLLQYSTHYFSLGNCHSIIFVQNVLIFTRACVLRSYNDLAHFR